MNITDFHFTASKPQNCHFPSDPGWFKVCSYCSLYCHCFCFFCRQFLMMSKAIIPLPIFCILTNASQWLRANLKSKLKLFKSQVKGLTIQHQTETKILPCLHVASIEYCCGDVWCLLQRDRKFNLTKRNVSAPYFAFHINNDKYILQFKKFHISYFWHSPLGLGNFLI